MYASLKPNDASKLCGVRAQVVTYLDGDEAGDDATVCSIMP